MINYLRVTDGKVVRWIMQVTTVQRDKGGLFTVFGTDNEVFQRLGTPHRSRWTVQGLTMEELWDKSHFESPEEQNTMLQAFADMITMEPSDAGPFAACSVANFKRCMDYCTGQEVELL